jgi:uncharacterized protein (DUF305 family)
MTMKRTTLVGTALAALTLGAVLTGSAGASIGDDMRNMGSPNRTASSQQNDYNQADVTFVQQMIPNHQQSLAIAKLVSGRTSNATIIDLAGRIEASRTAEVQQMTGWLTAWGGTPATTAVPGAVTAEELQRLEQASGADFDQLWLQVAVRHGQSAIEVAKREISQGSNAEAKALAQKIIDGQQAEIAEMQRLVGQS